MKQHVDLLEAALMDEGKVCVGAPLLTTYT